ncbi:MAG: hypothetical protein ACXWHB_17345 [Usitatibacter sp.]
MKRHRPLSPGFRVAAGFLAIASVAPGIGLIAGMPHMPALDDTIIMAVFGALMGYAALSGNAGAALESPTKSAKP